MNIKKKVGVKSEFKFNEAHENLTFLFKKLYIHTCSAPMKSIIDKNKFNMLNSRMIKTWNGSGMRS